MSGGTKPKRGCQRCGAPFEEGQDVGLTRVITAVYDDGTIRTDRTDRAFHVECPKEWTDA